MMLTVKQLWVLCIANGIASVLLEITGGAPVEDSFEYLAGIAVTAVGATVIGWSNRRQQANSTLAKG